MIIHFNHITGYPDDEPPITRPDATAITTCHSILTDTDECNPFVFLSCTLPCEREDLSLALAEYLSDAVVAFLDDYREDLILPGDLVQPVYVEGDPPE